MANLKVPVLNRVTYAPSRDHIVLRFTSGALLEIPRSSIDELRNLDVAHLRMLQPDNAGMTLSLRDLDIDIYVPGLIAETMGMRPATMLGKLGGAAKSSAKSRAAQQNGKKGGRPKVNA